jgi:hypothetical protein
MGSVKIDSGRPAAWQRPWDIPKDKWFFLMEEKRSFIQTNIPYDCRCLLEFVQDANEMWKELGFKSAEDMINKGYELDPVEVDLAYEWLSIQSPETAVDYETAVKGGRELRDRPGAPEGTINNPLGNNQYKKSDEVNYVNNTINQNGHGSTNIPYLTARLKRDNPEILEGLKNGEFKSVRQAAIAAGIVKVPTAFERILKLLPKISEEETKELQSRLSEMI